MTEGNNIVPKFEGNFQGFLNFLRDETETNFSPTRFAAILKTDINTLALQANGLLQGTAEPIAWRMQPYFREVVQVLRAAFDYSENVESAIFWYLNMPLSMFEYRTPAQLVSTGNAEVLLESLTIALIRRREDAME